MTIPVWQVSFDVRQVVKANLICFSKDNKGFLELLYGLVKGTVYSSMFFIEIVLEVYEPGSQLLQFPVVPLKTIVSNL